MRLTLHVPRCKQVHAGVKWHTTTTDTSVSNHDIQHSS